MAHAATAVWNCRSSATAGNLNGAGFNPGNTNFITDWTAASATGNSPVISSASYNFVAGDVGAWFYVKSGTNWTSGWYPIASVASNQATLNAAVGAAIQVDSAGNWRANTVAGCATTASPTGGVCGIDFSQSDSAIINNTDLASSNGTTNPAVISSAGSPFSNRLIGNYVHVTAGTNWTSSWYEIVSVSGANATLDRAVGAAASISGGTFYVGGSASLGSATANMTDLNFFNAKAAGNTIWIKQGTYTLGQAITSTVAGTTALPLYTRGFNSLRGDITTRSRSTMPKLIGAFYPSVLQYMSNIWFNQVTSTGNNGMDGGGIAYQCIFENTDTTADKVAAFCSSGSTFIECEVICTNGRGLVPNNGTLIVHGCYIHHCVDGLSLNNSTGGVTVSNSIFEASTNANIRFLNAVAACPTIINNTFYGAAAKLGVGVQFDSATAAQYNILNNVFYGLATAISANTQKDMNIIDYNTFFNNTTDCTNAIKRINNIATDPGFVGVTEITGTTATTSGSVLTQSGGDFSSVVDGISYLHLRSGTGITTGIYRIESHTATTVTLNNAPGTNATADKSWRIVTVHDYTPGAAMAAIATPKFFGPASVRSYLDLGAIQRDAPAQPSAADVRSGTVFGGGTGTLAVPAASNVLNGVAVDNTTGTYVAVATGDVRSGTTFGAASALTGTLAVPAAASVLNGVAVDATTGTYVGPATGNVKTGVTYGAASALTGTYDGSDRWTDPGESHVESGVTYKANSTSNNKTGTLSVGGGGTVGGGGPGGFGGGFG